MKLLDYECQTTFWEDFGIAEHFGEEAIRDTYKRTKAEWSTNRIYGTELSMVLNHKCWYWYEKQSEELIKLYAKLWGDIMGWCLITGRAKI